MVMKGWYIPSSPGSEGDSTVWYVSYWHFITAYLDKRFNGTWCLSPELSLYFHSGKTVIPKQLIVRCEKGTNNILQLPFGTSLVDIKASLPPEVIRNPRYGVRLYPMEYALLMVGPDYYRRDALEARTCLASLRDVSPIVLAAIDGGHTTRSGRVAGALRSIGREEMADELLRMMRQVGHTVTEENPFEENVRIVTFAESPYASRIRLMWMQMRKVVIDTIKIQHWDPEKNEEDKERRNALAARGYYQAYELLKQGVADCFSGKAPARLYVKGHQDWHFQLFEPCVRAGIVKASDLIGYRRHQVYIRNSMHTPLNPDAVLDSMSALSDLMMQEENALVRAILGHFFFVYIHPYMDGNGRTARFAMNSQLVTAGYLWVVIPVERRQEYMAVLEQASVEGNIEGFVRFIGRVMESQLFS